jgi:hypothetical protein
MMLCSLLIDEIIDIEDGENIITLYKKKPRATPLIDKNMEYQRTERSASAGKRKKDLEIEVVALTSLEDTTDLEQNKARRSRKERTILRSFHNSSSANSRKDLLENVRHPFPSTNSIKESYRAQMVFLR